MSNNAVKLESFTKKYSKKIACNEIDFTAEECSVTGLLGPNGAGKSTILKAIWGEIYPTTGFVSVCGFSRLEDIKKIIGYVPEIPELEENLTVKETLVLEAGLYSVKNAVDRIKEALSICQLTDVVSCKVKNLSKGYRQRVSLAKALCSDPKVLVLDEFSAGLDPVQTVQLRNNIKKLSEKITVIFSTHHIEEAVSLCKDIYILKRGVIAAHGTAESIAKDNGCHNLEEAFLKVTGEGIIHE